MYKTKKSIKITVSKTIASLAVAIVIVSSQAAGVSAATLDELRAQNATLQAQINDSNNQVKALAAQGDTLQGQLNILNAQIYNLRTQIDLTKGKIDELQIQLNNAQTELDRQKGLLKASVQALYKKGGASTVELLVGSDSFSQFINDQTYLEKLKSGIQDSAQKVIALKQQIQDQQAEQQKLLEQQKAQETELSQTQAAQQSLLDQTRGQEAAYRSIVKDLQARQAQIMADIYARTVASGVIISSGDGSNGGYPTAWANAPMYGGSDSWGMTVRQCVSYTAFKVWQSGRDMPTGWVGYSPSRPWGGYKGNAGNWPANARAIGIPVDRNPQVGDVAIAYLGYGPYDDVAGHAMYVEAVNGRMVTVSQFNYDYQGHYSMMTISADSSTLGPLDFIHFPY